MDNTGTLVCRKMIPNFEELRFDANRISSNSVVSDTTLVLRLKVRVKSYSISL